MAEAEAVVLIIRIPQHRAQANPDIAQTQITEGQAAKEEKPAAEMAATEGQAAAAAT